MPRETLRLLDVLERVGFSNEEFRQVHHFGEKANINTHRKYCEDVKKGFQAEGENEKVKARLAIIVRCIGAGGPAKRPSDWRVCIRKALEQVPF